MKRIAIPFALVLGVSVAGCSDLSNTQQKTLSGGAIGAGVGAAGTLVTGGCVTCGAAIGGAVGAGTCYVLSKTED